MQIDIDEDCHEGNPDLEGFRAHWAAPEQVGRCSVCHDRPKRVLKIEYEYQELRVCAPCATALRELLIDALEDEE